MHLLFTFLDLNFKFSENTEISEKFENYEDNFGELKQGKGLIMTKVQWCRYYYIPFACL